MSSSQSNARPSPKWRSSLSNPKRQRPAASVSLVFAQPEQGSKLGSAIDQLPAAVGFDDAASFMSQASRKRERTLSQASSFYARPEQPREERQAKRQDVRDEVQARSNLSVEVHESADLSASPSAEPSREGEQGQGSSPDPVDLAESPTSTQPQEPGAYKDDSLVPSTTQLPVPFPRVDPQKTVTASKSSPARSSWFGFSKAKAEDPNSPAKASGNTDEQIPSMSIGSATQSAEPVPPVVPSPSANQGSSSSSVSELTSSTTTLPQTIPPVKNPAGPMSFTPTQYSPPEHRINSNPTSISSVDEEVPRPRFNIDNAATLIPPQAVVESQVVRTVERKPSISSLNPSASRFTLKLPLLGRPKIPLEQAVAVAQAEDIRDPPKSADNAPHEQDSAILGDGPPTSVANGGTANETQAAAAEGEAGPSSSPQPEPSANVTESVDAKHNAHEPRSASWWDYIGWGGSTADGQNKPSEDSQAPTNQQDTAPAPTLTSPVADTVQGQEGPGATATLEPDRTSDTKEPASPTQPVAASDAQTQQSAAKPSSVFSSETVKSHGSAWYSPWAWYTTSPTTTTSAQGETAAATDEGSSGENENAKTESEMVKEEALARDQNTQTGVSAEPVKASSPPEAPADNAAPKTLLASPESLNPVESSIANNKSGWMSFLMSKALTVKPVTNESHEQQGDAMEVMDVDDAPETSEAIAIPTGNDVQRAGAASSLKSAASPSASSTVAPSTSKSPTGKSPTAPPLKEREPRKSDPPVAPLTDNESIKRDTTKGSSTRDPSPTPSKTSGTTPPNSARTATPNFVLPTWEDTFHSPPRSYVPPRNHGAKSKLTGALSYVAGALFSKDDRAHGKSKGKGKEREVEGPAPEFLTFGQELPKAFDVLGEQLNPYMLNGGCRVVVIGVAGWSPGAVTRTLAGGLPSSSGKFVNMTAQALEQFADEHGFKFKKITRMPLEGDGTIRKKVSRVYNHLVNNEEWMEDLHAADVIFVASHSQGAIISTHLVDRLIEDGHILTARSVDVLAKSAASIAAGGAAAVPATQAQKVCLLALCGIHLGPLRYLKTSSLLQPYIQYVENAAARELFEFQDTESKLSKNYIGALRNVMDHGAKVVYIASLNDQVVPIYSGLFTAASHPRILRALYIDNDAYHSSDFLSNLLILLIRIMNAGLSDRGLLAHLSEATAGTLSGVGHSTAYEELATYSLAVKYFFMTNDGTNADAELVINPFNAVEEQNDYEIPWLLRDMIADTKVAHFFAREFSQLRDAFDDWQPKTTILRDVKKKLQPITRLSTVQLPSTSISKL